MKDPPKVPAKKKDKNVMDDIDALIMEEDEGPDPEERKNNESDGGDEIDDEKAGFRDEIDQ